MWPLPSSPVLHIPNMDDAILLLSPCDRCIYADSEWEFGATGLTIIIKFWSAITYFAVNLQSMETYPTCLRQTGISIGIIFSNAVGVLGPYIAYLVNISQRQSRDAVLNFIYQLHLIRHTSIRTNAFSFYFPTSILVHSPEIVIRLEMIWQKKMPY